MDENERQSMKLYIGGGEGHIFEIHEGEALTMGRDPGCTIQINHHSISPLHCRVELHGGILFVSDLDSRRGLFVEDKRRKKLEIKSGDAFSLGPIEVRTSRGAPSAPAGKRRKLTIRSERLSGPVPGPSRRERTFFKTPPYKRRLRRIAPFLGVSLILHLVLWFLFADLPFITQRVHEAKQILTGFFDADPDLKLEEESLEAELVLEEPEVFHEEILQPPEESPIDENLLEAIVERPREIGITGVGPSRGSPYGLAGEGTASLRGGGYSKGFPEYIESLRDKGLDVAFVIDTTSSMVPFIDEAKRVVNRLISKLAAVVPDLRLAIVAFRDEGDDYVTRHLDLTRGRYEILNFLEDLEAAQGGDFPEALYEGLYRAVNSLVWRPEARKVIIVVGDAPFHEEDGTKLDRLLRAFHDSEVNGIVNALYIGADSDAQNGSQKEAIACMVHITEMAGGDFTRISENEKIVMHLVHIAFGKRWEKDISLLLQSVKKDRMSRIVERKAKLGDRRWLLDGLKRTPVRAGIVDALLKDSEPEDLEVLARYLESENLPAETRWAAFYILRRKLDQSLDFDPYSGPERRFRDIERIRKAIIYSRFK
jgi:Mg-chelatase subunit ChlD